MNRVSPREVAQAVKGSNDTRFYGVGSGDVGKELPRNKSVVCVSFVGGHAQKHHRKRFQDACLFRGYTLGSSIVVRGALPSSSNSNSISNSNSNSEDKGHSDQEI